MIEYEESGQTHIFQSILQIMLSYAKYGVIRYGDEPTSDERVQAVFGLISDIDRALQTHSSKERLEAVNIILIRCWEYLKGYLELLKAKYEAAEAAGESTEHMDALAAAMSGLAGSFAAGTGSMRPVREDGDEEEPSATEEEWEKTRAEAEESQTEDSDDESSSGSGAAAGKNSESEGAASVSSGGTGGGKQGAADKETGRIPLQHTDHVSEPAGGTTERDDDYQREMNASAASDIERILDRMAERAACRQLENERLQELNDTAQNISYGDIHSGVDIRVKRIASVDDDLIE